MFYLIDKPKGITSFFALKKVRARLGIKKIGHTGTLDPLASGLLLIATEQSTKLIPYVEKARKTYVFTMRMDGWTESGDLEKEVQPLDADLVKNKSQEITKEVLGTVLKEKFIGKCSQIPSKFSAIKIDGKAAYLSAHKGKDVVIPSRDIEISSLRLLDYSFPEATIEACVSAGTYIRTLASDIAKSVGLDAYLVSLRRTGINHLTLSQAHDIEHIEKTQIFEYCELFPDYPILEASDIPQEGKLTIPHIVATRLLNGLTQANQVGLTNNRYFLTIDGKIKALIEARNETLQIERNNISD